MRTIEDIQLDIIASTESPSHVRFLMKLRENPLYGKFVILKDHKELWKKGFVRFVSGANEENFDKTQNDTFSRILAVNDITFVWIYKDTVPQEDKSICGFISEDSLENNVAGMIRAGNHTDEYIDVIIKNKEHSETSFKDAKTLIIQHLKNGKENKF